METKSTCGESVQNFRNSQTVDKHNLPVVVKKINHLIADLIGTRGLHAPEGISHVGNQSEEKDNGRDLHLLRVSPQAAQSAQIVARLIEGLPLPTLVLPGKRVSAADNAPLYAPWQPEKTEDATLTLVPYFAWNNRGRGEMRVWLNRENG